MGGSWLAVEASVLAAAEVQEEAWALGLAVELALGSVLILVSGWGLALAEEW